MSLFFRQILILRHYVNYIEEKQDKSSIFLSSSVHTQAGVDIKILLDTPAPTSFYHVVALPSAAARSLKLSPSLPSADNGGVPTKTKTGVTVITPSTQSIRQTKTITWCQTYCAAPNPFWHVVNSIFHRRQRAPSSGHPHLVVASTLPSAEVAFPQSDGFYYRRQMGSPIIIIIF